MVAKRIGRGVSGLAAGVLCVLLAAGAGRAEPHPLHPPRLSLDESIFDAVRWVDLRQDDELYPVNVNNWWGLMNRQGELVVYPCFEWVDYAWDGRLRAVEGGLTGFVDARGRWLVEPAYPYADRYAEGYAVVSDGERFGYLDKAGRAFLPMALEGALRFREGYAAVQEEGRIGFIDRRGELAIPLRFVRARSFHNGVAMVQLPEENDPPGMLGYIDKRGRFVFADTEGRFTDLGDFHDGLARARVGRSWGYIDQQFRVRIEPAYEAAGNFHGGVAAVQVDGRWGYIDKTGRTVVEPAYHVATDFADGFGMVMEADAYGFVNRAGDERIALAFDWAQPFFRTLARVSQEPNFGYVDVSGRPVWDPRAPLRAIRNHKLHVAHLPDGRRVTRELRIIPPPPWRPPLHVPYPPDQLYEPELPRPPVP